MSIDNLFEDIFDFPCARYYNEWKQASDKKAAVTDTGGAVLWGKEGAGKKMFEEENRCVVIRMVKKDLIPNY